MSNSTDGSFSLAMDNSERGAASDQARETAGKHRRTTRDSAAIYFDRARVFVTPHWHRVRDAVVAYWNRACAFAEPYWQRLCTFAAPHWDRAKAFIAPYWERFSNFAAPHLNRAKAFIAPYWNPVRERVVAVYRRLGLDRYFGRHQPGAASRTVFAALGAVVIVGAGLTAVTSGSGQPEGPASAQAQRQDFQAQRNDPRALGQAKPITNAAQEQHPKPDWIRPSTKRISDVFGPRDWRAGEMHFGMDYAAGPGEPNYAAASGTVVRAESDPGYGNLVVVDHGGGLETWYGHHSKLSVKEGQKVSVGDTVGKAGSTGDVTGPHLHFEVRKDGVPVDPMKFLKDEGVKF